MTSTQRSQVDIPALTGFLDSILSYSRFLVQEVALAQQLYHYTDLAALVGIVSNHDLWLTDSRYSNDEDEIMHGYEVARCVVEEEILSANKQQRKDKPRLKFLRKLKKEIEQPLLQGFFVCCFCEDDNLLSQWRSYGANGTGASLAFDPMAFTPITGSDMPLGLMRLWKVFYSPDQQMDIVRSCINYAFDNYSEIALDEMVQRTVHAIQFFVPTFKNEDFSEENERRLIFTPDPECDVKPRYRIARGMLVPYYSIQELASRSVGADWHLPLRSVLIGPSAQQNLNAASTKLLLNQNGYGETTVAKSVTPYRG